MRNNLVDFRFGLERNGIDIACLLMEIDVLKPLWYLEKIMGWHCSDQPPVKPNGVLWANSLTFSQSQKALRSTSVSLRTRKSHVDIAASTT